MFGEAQDARVTECLALVSARPDDPCAWHDLAAALNQANRRGEAGKAAERAIALGLDAPETWLVLARARRGQSDFDGAEAAFREALRRRANFIAAQEDLAQLVWRRSGDLQCALEVFPLAGAGASLQGLARRADLLQAAGWDDEAGRVVLEALSRAPDHVPLLLMAAQLTTQSDPEGALAFALTADSLKPNHPPTLAAMCQAQLACGDGLVAVATAERLFECRPDDQFSAALLGTAWRLAMDARAEALADPDLVTVLELEPPSGWTTLDLFLADLSCELAPFHDLPMHPFGMSVRGGSQSTQDLRWATGPALSAFRDAVEAPVRADLARRGGRKDPFGRAWPTPLRMTGLWSVRLRPGGYHTNHVHPAGWLSSAFYVEVPTGGPDDEERRGWLAFGAPGVPTMPVLPPTLYQRPAPGRLVLFPAFLWHGTIPFHAPAGHRLSLAFDVGFR